MFENFFNMLTKYPELESILSIAWIVGKILLIIIPLMLAISYFVYTERKVIGFIQSRKGPNRVGPFGLLQPFADTVKLFFKEIIIPEKSNKYLFIIAPILAVIPALVAWSVIPFTGHLVIADLNIGILFLLAMASLGSYGVVVAGWSSNSKYAFLGSLRAIAQVISYEIPMSFSILGVLILAKSMNLSEIVFAQRGGIESWFWLPLFPLFLIYWISVLAETNRAPFDVAEGESELVAGFHVEYSGMAFSMFFLAEYSNMILASFLMVIMFFGGWFSPFASIPLIQQYFYFIPGIFWLLIKASFFMFSFLWFRATFPRYRYDQIMRLCWKIFLPITFFWIVLLGVAVRFGFIG